MRKGLEFFHSFTTLQAMCKRKPICAEETEARSSGALAGRKTITTIRLLKKHQVGKSGQMGQSYLLMRGAGAFRGSPGPAGRSAQDLYTLIL